MTVRASIDAAEPRIVLASEFHHKDLIKALPGSSWSSAERVWKLPLAWTSCLALRATFGEDLELEDDLKLWAWGEKTNRIDPAMKLREVLDLTEDGAPKTPITEAAIKLQDEIKLFPHQAAGAAFMATAETACIFDETGTGKSAQAISAMRILHRLGETVFPALVVAPNTVKRTWKRELEQWWPGLTVLTVEGGAAHRRKILQTPAHVYIINWESLHKHSRLARYGNTALKRCTECGGIDERITANACEVHKRELNYLTFNTVIADEVHRAKSPTSKQSRALLAASEGSQYRFGMTGTPIQDNIVDMWPVLRFVSPKEYPSKTRFIDRFAETGYSMWGAFTVFGVKKDAEEEFYGGLNPRLRRMLKKIVLPFLPPIIPDPRYIEMLPAQAKAYKQMVKETIADLEGGALIATNPLSRATRLLQFASAYAELETKELPDGRIETITKLISPSNKVNAFMDDIESGDFGDDSMVVFAQSRQLIDLLAAAMTKKEIKYGMITGGVSTDDRQKHIDDFQEGKTKYILVTIAAGGVGLTLTAARRMVFLQRAWSSIEMKQAISRAHRIGSERHDKIILTDYISEDTIEELQLIRLSGKYDRIESIVRDGDLLKKLLKGEVILEDEIKLIEESEASTDVSEII